MPFVKKRTRAPPCQQEPHDLHVPSELVHVQHRASDPPGEPHDLHVPSELVHVQPRASDPPGEPHDLHVPSELVHVQPCPPNDPAVAPVILDTVAKSAARTIFLMVLPLMLLAVARAIICAGMFVPEYGIGNLLFGVRVCRDPSSAHGATHRPGGSRWNQSVGHSVSLIRRSAARGGSRSPSIFFVQRTPHRVTKDGSSQFP